MRASGLGTKRTSGAHHVAYSWICSWTCRHSRSAVGLANIPDLQSDLQAFQICSRTCKHSKSAVGFAGLADAIALRGVVKYMAEALGVSTPNLLRRFVCELDLPASVAQLYSVL